MKKTILTLFAALLLFVIQSKAQFQQQDTTHVTITLKARHHAYLIAFMGDKGQVDRIRYVNQVASQITDTADRDKQITVIVGESLVKQLYITIGSQPERLTSVYNAEIKQVLVPQLIQYPNLLKAIQDIGTNNSAETENMVRYGFGFLQSIK